MWLAAHNKCWTVDPLARQGLQYPPRCPLCDQEGETINHLLLASVFSWQFWFRLLQRVGLQNLSPQRVESSFDGWCSRINKGVVKQVQQGLNSIVIISIWTIWKQCSLCVFYGLRALLVYLPCLLRERFFSPPGHGSVLWLWCMMGDPVV